ncbi:hypothetical protein ACDN41_11815 [Priestia aryabhattai]|uniref:hypothetical protein n=1 Tax=Priestia aryabhattai TaxID=412384 RepID=UPI0035319999
MTNKNDIVGNRYGRLTVNSFDGYVKVSVKEVKRRSVYKCECDCGESVTVKRNSLVTGHTKSCGCLEKGKEKHGLRSHPLYSTWLNMKDRCYNPNNSHYQYYGERGIHLCDEWKDDFKSFYDWSIDNGWRKGLSIERKDFNLSYHPDNCCWITLDQQSRNKSSNIKIKINGIEKCIAEWCEEFGFSHQTIYSRIERGWSNDILFKPKGYRRSKLDKDNAESNS